ncbi:MAG: PAS domain-containing protein [Deltaproteobacteria bacterium]|nr:PAS domain-containing protein [Deltaproteobacteria bacterium]
MEKEKPATAAWRQPRLQAVLDSIEEPLWLIDQRFQVATCNRAAAARLPDDWRRDGGPCYRLLFAQHGVCPFCGLQEVFRRGEGRQTNVSLLDRDGRNHVYELSFCPVREEAGTVGWCLVRFRDISENAGLFAEISRLKSLAAMGRYASELTHEIRNPLNSIEIQMTLLQRLVADLPPAVREPVNGIVEVVRQENRRLNSLAGEFLQVKKARELVISPVAVDDLLRQILELVADELAASRIEVELVTADRQLTVRGDRDKLHQAFLNLVKNSLEALGGREGGRLRVGIAAGEGEAVITFADNGPGIPYGDQPKIFNLFYTTKSSGTGIGLYLCRDIIEAHGGTISFVSDGEGTTFTVKLPLSTAAAP